MKLNPEEFALVPANKPESTDLSQYSDQNDNTQNERKDIQISVNLSPKAIIISHCIDLAGQALTTLNSIVTECQKTKQIQAIAMTRIREAEEQTERVKYQELYQTERAKEQYLAEIEIAKINLEKDLAEIEREKEMLLYDERKFNKAFESLKDIINNLLSINYRYISEDYSDNFDYIYKLNDQLIQLAGKVVELYNGKTEV